MVAAPDTLRGTGRRRRVAAIGSGFGGLAATKALRHAQVNITDAVVFLTRITTQGISHVVIQTPPWLQGIPASAGVAGTIGVLIALHVAAVREPLDALHRCSVPAFRERLSATSARYPREASWPWIRSARIGGGTPAQPPRSLPLPCGRQPHHNGAQACRDDLVAAAHDQGPGNP
jgi:hypothetical protein